MESCYKITQQIITEMKKLLEEEKAKDANANPQLKSFALRVVKYYEVYKRTIDEVQIVLSQDESGLNMVKFDS